MSNGSESSPYLHGRIALAGENAVDEFTKAYVEAALWTSMDESTPSGGYPLDKNYGPDDIAPETLALMEADCRKFQEAHAGDIAADLGLAGYHFWLTRCGHGSGYWNGCWPEDVGERLTDASQKYGEFNLYVGDDGLIHGYQG
jgi:hypothetical protein